MQLSLVIGCFELEWGRWERSVFVNGDVGEHSLSSSLWSELTFTFQARILNENAPDQTSRERFVLLEHETGFEPATLTLARESDPEEDQ